MAKYYAEIGVRYKRGFYLNENEVIEKELAKMKKHGFMPEGFSGFKYTQFKEEKSIIFFNDGSKRFECDLYITYTMPLFINAETDEQANEKLKDEMNSLWLSSNTKGWVFDDIFYPTSAIKVGELKFNSLIPKH